MREMTLVFFIRDNEILLAMKKDSFGAGNWNGYGGKLQSGETVLQAAIREVKEESSTDVKEQDLMRAGTMDFYFSDKPEWDQRVHIFRVERWKGEPAETEEMKKPVWFPFDKIPWQSMWAGDDQWIPHVLKNEHFSGEAHFTDKGQKLLKLNVEKKKI